MHTDSPPSLKGATFTRLRKKESEFLQISSEIAFNSPGMKAVAGSAKQPCLPHSSHGRSHLFTLPASSAFTHTGWDRLLPPSPGRWSMEERPLAVIVVLVLIDALTNFSSVFV